MILMYDQWWSETCVHHSMINISTQLFQTVQRWNLKICILLPQVISTGINTVNHKAVRTRAIQQMSCELDQSIFTEMEKKIYYHITTN